MENLRLRLSEKQRLGKVFQSTGTDSVGESTQENGAESAAKEAVTKRTRQLK